MPNESRQFGILYRSFLFRMIDLDVLTAKTGAERLLGQFAAVLAAFSLTCAVVSLPKYLSLKPHNSAIAARSEVEFLIATTMALSGFLTLLAWNSVLPDRRDCLTLGILPIRMRTMIAAKLAAIATVLGIGVVALNAFTGLCYPFVLLPPNSSSLLAVRVFLAYWATMIGAGVAMCFALLSLQFAAGQMFSYRVFLRVSAFMQLTGFVTIVTVYFLKPSFPTSVAAARDVAWEPSFWFSGLLDVLSGTSNGLLSYLAARALAFLGLGFVISIPFLAATYYRSVRHIVEQPEIAPSDRHRAANPAVRLLTRLTLWKPLDGAIVLYVFRTVTRSRQHRLLIAAYCGTGLAISLVYIKDLFRGYYSSLFWDTVSGPVKAAWNEPNSPLLIASITLLFFTIVGFKAVFSLPLSLPSNWIFRITEIRGARAYSSGVRTALLTLAAAPIWIAALIFFPAVWPPSPALEHVAILVALGLLIVNLVLVKFRKVPFACSWLPVKSVGVKSKLVTYAIVITFGTQILAEVELWALSDREGFFVLMGILLVASTWAWCRSVSLAKAAGNRIEFEEIADSEVAPLTLDFHKWDSGHETKSLDNTAGT